MQKAKSATRLAASAFSGAPNTRSEEQAIMNNQINLVGHVGKNPQTVSFEDTGNKVVKFSIAVKEYSANSEGESTIWIDVEAWNGLGARVEEVLTKGREVVITGRLAINSYAKVINGTTVQVTKPMVKLTSFHVCGRKPVAQQDNAGSSSDSSSDQRELATV